MSLEDFSRLLMLESIVGNAEPQIANKSLNRNQIPTSNPNKVDITGDVGTG